VRWLHLADTDERFEPHLEALLLGGDLALRVAIQQAIEGDAGELHTAVCLFCRHQRLDLVQKVIESLEDEERGQAVADALKLEMPGGWDEDAMEWIRTDGVQSGVGIQVAGYRRLDTGFALLKYLRRWEPLRQAEGIWALGRLRYEQARATLFETYLQHEDETVQAAAARALLRMGEAQVLAYCTRIASSRSWAWIPIGLGGSRTDVSRLVAEVNKGGAAPECICALGLLGDLAAIPILMPLLQDQAQAPAVAMALNLLTGANLYEEVFVPDEINEDELLDEEREKLARGESIYPPGVDPPGVTLVQLAQDLARWQAWWAENQGAFSYGVRYRNGKPYAPARLLENLTDPLSTNQVRRWAAEELAIRYRWESVFETDLTVSTQQDILAQAASWGASQEAFFIAGRWYLAGKPVS
jgi:uncharacterized protein (TIGR02270 family)